jgi:hypothetical protein
MKENGNKHVHQDCHNIQSFNNEMPTRYQKQRQQSPTNKENSHSWSPNEFFKQKAMLNKPLLAAEK